MAVKRRTSIFAAVPDAKKQCTAVSKAILVSQELPESCTRLLNGMAVNALSTYAEERHPFQSRVVSMISTALSDIETAMVKRDTDTEARVASAEEEKAGREVAMQKAEDAKKAACSEAEAKKAACNEADATLAAAKGALADAAKKKKLADAAVAKLKEQQAKVDSFRTGVFISMKEGVIEKQYQPRIFKQAAAFYAEFQVEKAMVTAATDALHQPPADRSTFLVTAISQLEEKLKVLAADFGNRIEVEESAQKEASRVVDEAQAAVDAASASVAEASASLKEATSQQKAAQAALRDAEAAVRNYFADMKKMMDGFDRSKHDLNEFQTNILGAFKELETLSAPPAPPAEPDDICDVTFEAAQE